MARPNNTVSLLWNLQEVFAILAMCH
jgi:hypothetical protein